MCGHEDAWDYGADCAGEVPLLSSLVLGAVAIADDYFHI